MAQAAENGEGRVLGFDAWLRRFLAERRISQEAFARVVGVSRNTANRWATGKDEPRFGHLRKIADEYGVLPPFRAGISETRVVLNGKTPLRQVPTSGKGSEIVQPPLIRKHDSR